MKNGKLQAAVIGLGEGFRHVKAYKTTPDYDLVAVCDPLPDPLPPHMQARLAEYDLAHTTRRYHDYKEVVNDPEIDVASVVSPDYYHAEQAIALLEAGKHVLCEIPFTLSKAEAQELYQMAEERHLVLMEASKTAYCPAFGHVVTLVKSGVIGEVVDVMASLSKMVEAPTRELDPAQAGGAMTEHAPLTLMAIVKLLGTEWKDLSYHTKRQDGVDIYTKGVINYPHATSSFTLGIGVKTEGNLVISGTKGYVYVPAPWWLTSYFEVRYEDQTKNRKYFYSYDGEGLRYEIQEFLSMVVNDRRSSYKLRRHESVAIADIIGRFRAGENVTEI